MFSFEFYPTPSPVIDQMVDDVEVRDKIAYDPQGGTGHIVKRLQELGAKQVYGTEKDPDLRKILQTKCVIIGDDFFNVTAEQISHIELIVMNPPFSNGAAHIVHAFNIAPDGCKIRALCNIETFKNAYSKSREELKNIVERYGSFEDLGNCFSTSERKTDVVVALLRIDKPGGAANEFDGFIMEEEPEEKTGPGLMPYNLVRDLVNRYVEAVRIYDEQLETAVRLNEMTSGFYGGKIGFQITRNQMPLERNEFKKGMQKAGWLHIFSKLNMEKHVTRRLKEDINAFVEKQQNVPFTMRNIYKMLSIVIGTTEARMDRAILDVFDKVTSYHDDNKKGVPGWKTNSHYLLTRRFIMPTLTTVRDGGYVDANSSDNFEMVEDMVKALCYVTGDDYGTMMSLRKFLSKPYYLVKDGEFVRDKEGKLVCEAHEYQMESRKYYFPGTEIAFQPLHFGEWFDWGYFRIRAYKKGTIHFEFKDEKVWAAFNQRVAKLKGYPLHEKKNHTAYQRRQHGFKKPSEPKPRSKAAPAKPVILGTFTIKAA